jgi:hypothetical protein
MNIRFVSSLTPDDEDRLAPAVIGAIAPLLDQLPIAYTVRIETAAGRVFQHAHTGADSPDASDTSLAGPMADLLRPRTRLS